HRISNLGRPGTPRHPPAASSPWRSCLPRERSALAEERAAGFTGFYLNILPSVTSQQTSRAFREAAMASNSQEADQNRNKSKKMENEASENPPLSDKTDLAPSEDSQSLFKTEPLEKVLNEISKEINNLLSKYADTISARIALDSSYVQELDEILKEARAIEKHLKQKREKLKQRFAVIANSLQS
ncbi:testis-expressed protein 12, partial [Zonotrichia albicollis]|uniref:testis-expressed protein 12 n=1 Tax=Zonotrichia albicollis TaxID=44394 RepID=UPI003D810A92